MHPHQAEPDQENHQLAVERCKIVRGWLQNPEPNIEQSIAELIQIVESLGDESTQEAVEIRDLAGELWRSLAMMSEDVEAARETLLMGVQLFTSGPEADTLDNMLYLAEQGCILHRAIEIHADQPWPAWLEESDAPQNLTRLVKAFDILGKSENWPNLQTRLDQYRQVFLVEMLPAYLENLYQSARQYARDRNFAMANLTVEIALNLFQHEIRPYVELGFTEDELHQLKDTLTIREQAEVILWTAAVRLTDPDTQFREVVPEISVLILNHPDVPVEDLNSLIGDLYQAEKIETIYLRTLDLENFTEDINTYREVRDIHFSILDELPLFLNQADFKLANKLQDRFKELADSFNNAADETALTLAQRVQSEITNDVHITDSILFLRNYWQVFWCLRSGIIKNSSVEDAVKEAITLAELTMDSLPSRVAEKFSQINSAADLDGILMYLEATRNLNQGFVHDLDHNQIQIHQLPSTPIGLEFPDTTPKYDDAILEIWAAIIKIWMGINLTPQSPDQADKSVALDVQDSIQLVFELLRDLSVLKKDIWPGLNLNTWSDNSRLGVLNAEILQLNQLINVLNDLDSKSEVDSPLDVLVYLDEQIKRSGLHEKIKTQTSWLVETPRNCFLQSLKNRYKQAEKDVNQHISNLLKDKSRSVKKFGEEFLGKPLNVATAEYLLKAIYSITDRLAQVYVHSGDVASALSIWDTIVRASSPWKTLRDLENRDIPTNPEVDEIWHELYKKTSRARFAVLITSRKREIIISCAVILLVIIVWVSIHTFYPSPREESHVYTVTIEDNAASGASSTDFGAQIAIQYTGTVEPDLTATAQLNNQLTATQQAADSFSGTSTSAAEAVRATVNANQETSLAQEATAQAANTTMQVEATAAAVILQCLEAETYSLSVSSEPDLEPPVGTDYITGTTPIQPTVYWEVTNLSTCEWKEILIKPISGENEVEYALWRGNQQVTDLGNQPVENGKSIKIALTFNIKDATDVRGEWVLIVNGLELIEEPHLTMDVENWINLITPPSSRP